MNKSESGIRSSRGERERSIRPGTTPVQFLNAPLSQQPR